MIDSVARLQRARKNGEDEGFTLIELLVVVVIIGILIAIAVPLYLNYRKGANDKAAQSDLRAAVSSLEQCMSDNSSYPTAVATDNSLTGCTGGKLTKSDNTTLNFYPSTATSPANYFIVSKSDKGTDKRWYCYASEAGGSVKGFTYTTAPSAYATACPANN